MVMATIVMYSKAVTLCRVSQRAWGSERGAGGRQTRTRVERATCQETHLLDEVDAEDKNERGYDHDGQETDDGRSGEHDAGGGGSEHAACESRSAAEPVDCRGGGTAISLAHSSPDWVQMVGADSQRTVLT